MVSFGQDGSLPYLYYGDYRPFIQEGNLADIIQGDTDRRLRVELAAQAEAAGFLIQKYDLSTEFTSTSPWSVGHTSYGAAARVYLDADAWVASQAYGIGNAVIFNGSFYVCNTNNSDAAFTLAKWDLKGLQYALFHVKDPFPVFDFDAGVYKIGDQVLWKGKTYTALQPTVFPDHESLLQDQYTQGIPPTNVFPDEPVDGPVAWADGGIYVIGSLIDILDTNYWVASDNRDQMMVMKLVDIALYHLHSSISPRNVPQVRVERYKGAEAEITPSAEKGIVYPVYSALGWLQACARGEITPNLPLIQPVQGQRIIYGGKIKVNNSY